jgi:SAM-dependent methyltransferase
MPDYDPILECIACGHKDLLPAFDLGWQPLANTYKTDASVAEHTYPLAINSCNHCRHIQLTHKVKSELLFKDYAYVSGVSKTALEFFDWFAHMSLKYFEQPPQSVLDIGCNDGSQLDCYKNLGMHTCGVDPAQTLYPHTSQRHNVICDFFRAGLVDGMFDIITVQNAFAHNSNQLELLENIKPLMKDSSVLFAVTSHADMLVNGEFDTIYHEHLSFYNIQSMRYLCTRAGLHLTDVRKHPIHGGSYIFVIQTQSRNADHVQHCVDLEKDKGLYSLEILKTFRQKAILCVNNTREFVQQCHNLNIPVVGYAAPAKSSVFLNYSRIKPQMIIEDTPLKQNTHSAGMNVPILPPSAFEKLQEYEKVCFIVLAWNFYPEIQNKILQRRPNKQDVFVKYLPHFEVSGSLV